MDSITELIKNEIKLQYKSVKRFSEVSGVPYSTLSNALAKGIEGTSYETVVKICKLLDIKQATDGDIVLFNNRFHDIYTKLTKLDDRGLHTVSTVLNVEYERCCSNSEEEDYVKGFNGIGLAGKQGDSIDTEQIKSLIKEVLKDG